MPYQPFMTQIGKTMGGAVAQQGQNELMQAAYMGKPGALEQLSAVNPQAAQQIQQSKKQEAQAKLQTSKDKSRAIEQLRKIKADVQENLKNFKTFEEAKSYYDQQVQMNQELINLAGVTPEQLELTPEGFEQIKQVEGTAGAKPFEGKGMDAQVSNILTQGVGDPQFRQSPEYARAYQLATEPKVIKTPTGDILLPPVLPAIFKAPGEVDKSEGEQVKEITDKTRQDATTIIESSKPKYIPGTERPEKFAEGEKKASGFYDRMMADEANIAKLEGFDPTSPKEVALGLSNVTATPEMQLYRQSADDWIRAKLRQESGAVIAEEEMAAEYRTYFPRLGDGPAVIAQKAEARRIATEAMKKAGGQAIKAAGPPKTGDIISGYRFKGGDPSKKENWELQ